MTDQVWNAETGVKTIVRIRRRRQVTAPVRNAFGMIRKGSERLDENGARPSRNSAGILTDLCVLGHAVR
jgi:hypothetical protein